MLFEQLAETFPLEVVEPYGEVLVVPVKAFKAEWRKQLESEGVQIYSNAFRGQMCFFLRKKPQTQQTSQTEPETKPQKGVYSFKPWSPEEEETIMKLKAEGLSFKAIAEKLGRTVSACRVKWKRLMDKTERKQASSTVEEVKTQKTDNDSLQEFLSALQTLYASRHRRICLVMLQNARLFLEEGDEKP